MSIPIEFIDSAKQSSNRFYKTIYFYTKYSNTFSIGLGRLKGWRKDNPTIIKTQTYFPKHS